MLIECKLKKKFKISYFAVYCADIRGIYGFFLVLIANFAKCYDAWMILIQEFLKRAGGHESLVVIILAFFTTLYTFHLLPHLLCTKWLLGRPGNFERKKNCLLFSDWYMNSLSFLFLYRYNFPSLRMNESFLCAIFSLFSISIFSLKLLIWHFFEQGRSYRISGNFRYYLILLFLQSL